MEQDNNVVITGAHKPLRALLDELEWESRFGGADGLLSAANALLARIKYDTYEFVHKSASNDWQPQSILSSNLDVIKGNIEKLTGDCCYMSLYRECGHCGARTCITSTSGGVQDSSYFAEDIYKHWPEEL